MQRSENFVMQELGSKNLVCSNIRAEAFIFPNLLTLSDTEQQ